MNTHQNLPTANAPEIGEIMTLLESVIDPEAGLSIVDMGLLYEVRPSERGVYIKMTMTSAACPMGDMIVSDIKRCLRGRYLAEENIDIEITFDPPWNPAMMSASARERFGW